MTVVLRPPQQFDPIDSLPLLGALGDRVNTLVKVWNHGSGEVAK